MHERKHYIGGSDIAVLLGLSPWVTPVQLWLEKTEREQPVFSAATDERMAWGSRLEAVIADHYAATVAPVQRVNVELRHPTVSIAVGHIDRAIVAPGKRARFSLAKGLSADGVLEIKTASAASSRSPDWGDPGTDRIPAYYWAQLQWYLGLARVERGDLAVLFGGNEFRVYTMRADAATFAQMLAAAQDWWQRHVVADVAPPATSEADAKRLWRSHNPGKTVDIDDAAASKWRELAEVKRQLAALEKREQELRDALLPSVGDAEAVQYQGRTIATWRQGKDVAVTDWRAVAAALSPPEDLVQQHTRTRPGARVLRLMEEA